MQLPDGESERVYFAEPFLVRKCWDVMSKAFECVVDRLHSLPFAKICRVTLLHLLPKRFPVADTTLASRVRSLTLVTEADRVAAADHRGIV